MWRKFLPENSRQYREDTARRISWGHWFALFNLLLALAIASRYAFNADWPNTLSGKLYFFISLLGHFGFVVFGLYLLLLFPLSFVIRHNRTYRSVSVVLASLGMTLLLVDTEVFKRFYLHLSPLVWELLINPDEAELARQWQLLFVPIPLIFLAQMLYSRWCWHKLRHFNRQRWGKYVALVFLSCFIATHLIYAWADMAQYRPITAQKANYPLSYPMTARSFLERHHLLDKTAFTQQLETEGRLDTFFLNYPLKPLEYKGEPQRINVLFVNLSGLQRAAISTETMPRLSAIAQQSWQFTQHYTGGNSRNGGITSLFYGLSGRYIDAILHEKTPSRLIATLQNFDYQFGLFSHNNFADPLYRRALFAGFKLPTSHGNQDTITQWQQWLIQRNALPFFSYVELDGTANDTDQQIDRIWQSLNQQGLLPRTLVIMTADISLAPSSSNPFDAAVIQVPMLLYWQGEPKRYLSPSSHLDLVPTILSRFFGVTSPVKHYAQGVDLGQTNERRWVLSANYKTHVAIMPNGEQFHIDHKGDFEHYSVEGERIPHSRPPLAIVLQLLQQSNQFVEK